MKILEVFVFLSLLQQLQLIQGSDGNERKTYIVYMGDFPKINSSPLIESHHNLLSEVIGDEKIARESMIYSYRRSFNALAARLLPEEVKKLSEIEGVASVFPSKVRKLHTTSSWNFIGFSTTARRNLKGERDVIIGLLDTGIWPSSPSFNDKGLGPPPSKWKGTCKNVGNFTGCNNKIIGAKYYRLEGGQPSSDIASPIDVNGHGTHTSSTIAGALVPEASLYGLANGTARGGVPSARLAVYKVCWSGEGCSDTDILAAFDDAISDGVDVISISIGGNVMNYFDDPIAIGAFHGIRKGVLTACSAGNDGPTRGSVVNVAPWIITVGASATDRRFKTMIKLGNGRRLKGISINTYSPKKKIYPLISGANAVNDSMIAYGYASACDYYTLDMNKVRGKIVYCLDGIGGQDESVKASGGSGALIQSYTNIDTAFSFVLPAAYITIPTVDIVTKYINSTRKPRAIIYKSVAVNQSAPFVAEFSSRGPNAASAKILKPDVAAPGVDILAAYTRLSTVTGSSEDDRYTDFNIMSGTSMSCPHVSAAAAYIKSYRPDWSPSAIKSAIITTTKQMSHHKNVDAEFAYGAGQVNPAKAMHPGLVYDMDEFSYIRFLCKEGYDDALLAMILGNGNVNCSKLKPASGYDGINYPTFQLQVASGQHPISAIFHRTVTNVGTAKTTYKVFVNSPKGLSVRVIPDTLKFKRLNEKKSFKVIVKGTHLGLERMLSAELAWHDSAHSVRSPIVVYRAD